MKKVLAIDMDGVLGNLVSPWVRRINESEGENVSANDIKSWNIGRYFSCGKRVYDYLSYDLFRNLPVIEDSQRVVEKLQDKFQVYIVTSATNNHDSLKAKMEWLEEHFPFIPASNIVLCGSKSIIKADYMIDDGIHNLEVFDGHGILFNASHNQQEDRFPRAMDWNEIEKMLL